MKFGIAILVALVVFLSPSVHGGETDVIRVFDQTLRLTNEEMTEYLKQADLENHGFEKTVEESTETDENGKITKKRTIYYKVTDDCSMVKYWDGVLKQRLPQKLTSLEVFSSTVKEIESRIAGRKTKSCTVGLEVHPNRCLIETTGKSKRSADENKDEKVAENPAPCYHCCGVCIFCWKAKISYEFVQ